MNRGVGDYSPYYIYLAVDGYPQLAWRREQKRAALMDVIPDDAHRIIFYGAAIGLAWAFMARACVSASGGAIAHAMVLS